MDSDDKPLSPEQLLVERRRLVVSRLYLRGLSYREIAAELPADLRVSYGQVRRDLLAVREEWRAEAAGNVGEAVEKQVARYEHLIAVAFRAWEESRGTHTVTKTESAGIAAGGEGEKEKKPTFGDKTTTTAEDLVGDPRFLAEVRHCQEQIAKLRGLNAAIKVESTHKGVLAVDAKLAEGV